MVDYREVLKAHGFDPETKEEYIEVLSQTHGDIEDAKAAMIFIADEEEIDLDGPDIEAVTDEPAIATFT